MTPRTSYGSGGTGALGGGVISAVDAGSPAERAGLVAGESVLTAAGELLRDVIDWWWLADGPSVEVRVASAGAQGVEVPSAAGPLSRQVRLDREPGEAWGICFAQTVFDGVRVCRNRCAFCFMAQLPKGLRRALYIRDDDFRLSFLQGNFITLTNLSDSDVARISDQHLAPLYISLQSVDPGVRSRLICAHEDPALERFDELLAAGIDLHVQIVLVPGVNDGEDLDQTLSWLAEREGVLSIGVVPLGYTAHQVRFHASYECTGAAAAVIRQVEPWQEALRDRDGVTLVYLADEFYLNALEDVPSADEYDGYPQFENGIGLVRSFIDDLAANGAEYRETIGSLPVGVGVTLVTGALFAPVLEREMAAVLRGVPGARGAAPGRAFDVLAVENRFFGGNVSVAGLLAGDDLLRAIAAGPAGRVYLVPDVVANADGLLLDDVPASELSARTNRDVRLVSCDARGLLLGLADLAARTLPATDSAALGAQGTLGTEH